MKQKLLKIQKDKISSSDLGVYETPKSISQSRKWEHQIIIEEKKDLSLKEDLDKVRYELEGSI